MNVQTTSLEPFFTPAKQEPLVLVQRMKDRAAPSFDTLPDQTDRPRQSSARTPSHNSDTRAAKTTKADASFVAPTPTQAIEETPKPVPERQPLPQDTERNEEVQFVRVDEASASETPDPRASRISKFNSRATEEHRTLLTAEKTGRLQPAFRELLAQRDDGQTGVERNASDARPSTGSTQSSLPGTRHVPTGTEGDLSGSPPNSVVERSNGVGEYSGASGRSGGERAEHRPQARNGGASYNDANLTKTGFTPSKEPSLVPIGRAPSTWDPKVVRVTLMQPRSETSPSNDQAPSTKAVETTAQVKRMDDYQGQQRRDTKTDIQSGPSTRPLTVKEPQPATDQELKSQQPAVEVRALGPDEVDPVSDLRKALGWSGLEQASTQPRQGSVGLVGSSGRSASSPQTVLPDEFPLATDAAVAAIATELGAYLHEVDLRISQAWNEADLPIEDRALGIQGRVTISIKIRSNGRVMHTEILASSGNARLDAMAAGAVPKRFKSFPGSLDTQGITHRVTLRYSNPLILKTE